MNLKLEASDDTQPLHPGKSYAGLGTDALTQTQIAVIAEWLPEVGDPELRARLAELLWNIGPAPKHRFGRAAVTAYCESALRYLDSGGMHHNAVDSIERALALAAKFGMSDIPARCVAEVLSGKHGENIGPRDARLLQLQLRHKLQDPAVIAATAEQEAERLEDVAKSETYATNLHLMIARTYWEVTARARSRVPGAAKAWIDDARLRAAETYVKEADKARDAKQDWVEAHFLADAIGELRKIGAQQARSTELQTRMIEAQRRAPMATITVDLVSHAEDAASAVAGRSLGDALTALTQIVAPPSKEQLRRDAVAHLSGGAAARFIPTTLVSSDARIVARAPAYTGDADSAEADEATILVEMYRRATTHRTEAIGPVLIATQQIAGEHNPTRADIAALVRTSALVPQGHERLFARGLHAGLHGDYDVATHILLPQLENALRAYIENVIGKPMVKHADDGTQTMNLFARVLAQPELVAVLGEDLVFDLESLLLVQESTNLRNNTCHGLLADADVGVAAVYAWWLCLRLCVTLPAATSTR